jgi:hypothetical protein
VAAVAAIGDIVFVSTASGIVSFDEAGPARTFPTEGLADDIEIDGTTLYFFDHAGLKKAAALTGEVTTILDEAFTGALAVGASCVYFVDPKESAVKAILK